ncbi:MAG: MarR family transcriptional regulator [Planctomycetota bacterium]
MNNSKNQQNDPGPAWSLLLTAGGAIQAALAEAEPAMADAGLADAKAFFLLSSVPDHPHPAALAGALMLPRPTVSFLIKRAEAAGHLERHPDPGDLRRFRLSLTPAGRAAVRRGRDAIDRAWSKRMARLTPAEARRFAQTVQKLAAPPVTTHPGRPPE